MDDVQIPFRMMPMKPVLNLSSFVEDIRAIITDARAEAAGAINSAMIRAYWRIGKRIVEEDQKGSIRAEYGDRTLRNISQELTRTLGKGYTERNLRNYRQFFLMFRDEEIWHTRVPNLT